MHDLIIEALKATYGFDLWQFENEAEFKHEIFHQLSLKTVDGVRLSHQVPGSQTCRLHAEGKIENGNPSKADLLICDPFQRQRFNWHVDYLIELKARCNQRLVVEELEKFGRYTRTCKAAYFIAERGKLPDLSAISIPEGVQVLGRESVLATKTSQPRHTEVAMTLEQAYQEVVRATAELLQLYGSNRGQYHSFFWCNYEWEEGRKHSFPCEGDFVAQLYHLLRTRLSEAIEIRSEVHPARTNARIDLVIRDKAAGWCIPVEVKMNWDQFKPKYKKGVLQSSEAHSIIDKMHGMCGTHIRTKPIVIVLQWAWQTARDLRADALPELRSATFPVAFGGFDEISSSVFWEEMQAGKLS